MTKVGNYVQRDYHNRFRSKQKKTWSDYNKSWSQRRQASAAKAQQLRNVAASFTTISVQASQANTSFVMQNQGTLGTYASQTAALSRYNFLA